jgi:hypothetical protein
MTRVLVPFVPTKVQWSQTMKIVVKYVSCAYSSEFFNFHVICVRIITRFVLRMKLPKRKPNGFDRGDMDSCPWLNPGTTKEIRFDDDVYSSWMLLTVNCSIVDRRRGVLRGSRSRKCTRRLLVKTELSWFLLGYNWIESS